MAKCRVIQEITYELTLNEKEGDYIMRLLRNPGISRLPAEVKMANYILSVMMPDCEADLLVSSKNQ